MKKLIFLLCLFLLPMMVLADRGDGEQIFIMKKGNGGHLENYPIADMPDAVYYDSDEEEIIIVADGTSLYYNLPLL